MVTSEIVEETLTRKFEFLMAKVCLNTKLSEDLYGFEAEQQIVQETKAARDNMVSDIKRFDAELLNLNGKHSTQKVSKAKAPDQIDNVLNTYYYRLLASLSSNYDKYGLINTEEKMYANVTCNLRSHNTEQQPNNEFQTWHDRSVSEQDRQSTITEHVSQNYSDRYKQFGYSNLINVLFDTSKSNHRVFKFHNNSIYGHAIIFYETPDSVGDEICCPFIVEHQASEDTGKVLTGAVKKMLNSIEMPNRGKDKRNKIVLSPKLASQGGEAELIFNRKGQTQSLKVNLPAGLKEGMQIKLNGMGEAGKGRGRPGDLFLTVRVKTP